MTNNQPNQAGTENASTDVFAAARWFGSLWNSSAKAVSLDVDAGQTDRCPGAAGGAAMSPQGFVPLLEWHQVYSRPMRVAILKRRSNDDPDTKSLQVQHDAIMRWLETLPVGSWTCDLRPAEEGGDNYEQIVSAWKGKGNHRLLKQIMARLTEYDVVVVYRIDRFGRNVLTVLTALEEMKEAGVRLFSVEENLDTANPAQQFNSHLFVLLAQHSSDLTSERIRGNKARAKELGGWRGGAITYGYRKAMTTGPDGKQGCVLDGHGYKTLEHDPAEVEHLRQAVAWIVDEDWSLAAVVRRLNAMGVPSPRGLRTLSDGSTERVLWTTTGLRRILANPALKGYDVVGVGGQRFQIHRVDGRRHRPHPPILTDDRWQALQQALPAPGGRRRPAREAMLAGLVWCHATRVNGKPCGRLMYGPGTVTADSASYTCRTSNNLETSDPERCTGNSISAKNLHRLIELVVEGIAADPRWPAALEAAYAAASRGPAAAATLVDVDSELAKLDASLADLRAERDEAKSERRKAQIKTEIDALDTKIAELETSQATLDTSSAPALPLLDQWAVMSTGQRRALLTTLVERIEILPFSSGQSRRGRAFDPSRVRMELRHVGSFHITVPVDTRPVEVSCPECGESFGEGSALGVHRRHKHGVAGARARGAGGRTVYDCPEPDCDRRTTSAGGMRRHITAAHGTAAAFPCPLGCSKVFRSPLDLASHVRMTHQRARDQAPTVCQACGRVFNGDLGLRIHAGRVHGVGDGAAASA